MLDKLIEKWNLKKLIILELRRRGEMCTITMTINIIIMVMY